MNVDKLLVNKMKKSSFKSKFTKHVLEYNYVIYFNIENILNKQIHMF